MTSLTEFATAQENLVRERAALVRRYLELKPLADSEQIVRRELNTFSIMLRGVSVREFFGEVFNPGSFSNGIR